VPQLYTIDDGELIRAAGSAIVVAHGGADAGLRRQPGFSLNF
jgi:hypothetical protein